MKSTSSMVRWPMLFSPSSAVPVCSTLEHSHSSQLPWKWTNGLSKRTVVFHSCQLSWLKSKSAGFHRQRNQLSKVERACQCQASASQIFHANAMVDWTQKDLATFGARSKQISCKGYPPLSLGHLQLRSSAGARSRFEAKTSSFGHVLN